MNNFEYNPNETEQFSNYWFYTFSKDTWPVIQNEILNKTNVYILEIGSHEGRSTCWFLNYVCWKEKSRIVSIDPYLTDDTTTQVTNQTVERFTKNVSCQRDAYKLLQYRDKSENVLKFLKHKGNRCGDFDLIYIDGSHLEEDVYNDMKNCHIMLAFNGFMILDDYHDSENVQKACQRFLNELQDNYLIIFKNIQIVLKKIK
jgi:predicted O-methyltransferase YrrM